MSFSTFCQAFQIKLAKPATAEQIAAAEEKLGAALPKSVRKIYESANGGQAKHDHSSLKLYSLKQALPYARVPRFFDAHWALWPLFENNDSNPLCVCCKPPLVGYVVLMSHDDAPRLMFRSLEGFFTAATDFIASAEYLETRDLPTDFAGPARTTADMAAAKRLIALAHKPGALGDEDRTDALCFAADLLSDADADQIQALLDFGDQHAAEYLAARLGRVQGSKRRGAARKVKATRESFDEFVVRCGDILTQAGVAASVVAMYGENTIRLDPGPIWMNMRMFFAERRRPDFNDFLLEKARAAGGKKRK